MGIELFSLLLSTGGAAMIWAIVQSWRAIRSGALADEKSQVDVAEERRRTAELDRDSAIGVAHYWRSRAGVLEYLLAKNLGAGSIPEFPPPPQGLLVPEPTQSASGNQQRMDEMLKMEELEGE